MGYQVEILRNPSSGGTAYARKFAYRKDAQRYVDTIVEMGGEAKILKLKSRANQYRSLTQWLGGVPSHDDFGRPITQGFIDGRTTLRNGNTWAIMNPESWLYEGCGTLGPGCGQRYHRGVDDKFYKVEG